MKVFFYTVMGASLLSIASLSFAQSNGPVTREEVRNELIQLENAGYHPGLANDPYYPADIQAAEERVQQQKHEMTAPAPQQQPMQP